MEERTVTRPRRNVAAAQLALVVGLCIALCGHCDSSLAAAGQAQPPNILFIVADDLGWNDVGWHGSEIHTPNLDALAMSGVRLDHSYVQPICSPTRSSIMSGKFVSHTGIQSLILSPKPCGLPTNITTIAQQLKQRGYATHAVGKWHQGYCKPAYTPSHRGFDTFFGYYSGAEEYFSHYRKDHAGKLTWNALDFHFDTPENYTNVRNMNGTYSANAFTDQAIKVMDEHDKTTPLYIYLPFQSVHSPMEVPPQYPAKYPKINDQNRKTFAGMVSALDEAVGNVTSAWKHNGL
eukprot:scpid95216/ scgid32902/ Arylsulfatase B; N-acetylgalactosamine-4-sulfatase